MEAISRMLRATLGFFGSLGNVVTGPFKAYAAKRAAKQAAKPPKVKKVAVRKPDRAPREAFMSHCKACKTQTGTSRAGIEYRQGWLGLFLPNTQFGICDKCGGRKPLHGRIVSIGEQPV